MIFLLKGAIPATIGMINGRIKVGLDSEMLTRLACPDTTKIKISRRDFPFALSEVISNI